MWLPLEGFVSTGNKSLELQSSSSQNNSNSNGNKVKAKGEVHIVAQFVLAPGSSISVRRRQQKEVFLEIVLCLSSIPGKLFLMDMVSLFLDSATASKSICDQRRRTKVHSKGWLGWLWWWWGWGWDGWRSIIGWLDGCKLFAKFRRWRCRGRKGISNIQIGTKGKEGEIHYPKKEIIEKIKHESLLFFLLNFHLSIYSFLF